MAQNLISGSAISLPSIPVCYRMASVLPPPISSLYLILLGNQPSQSGRQSLTLLAGRRVAVIHAVGAVVSCWGGMINLADLSP